MHLCVYERDSGIVLDLDDDDDFLIGALHTILVRVRLRWFTKTSSVLFQAKIKLLT